MSASDYLINFPYGATSYPYTAAHPHRGDDRACPEGTPVIVGNRQIGLTGHTGSYLGEGYAPHLHIQEWQGDGANTRKPQNAFKPGTVTEVRWESTLGNMVTIRNADGWNDSYCHLSRQDVKVGDIIGGTMSQTDLGQARIMAFHIAGRNGFDGRKNALNGETDADLNAAHVGKDTVQELWNWYNSVEGKNYREVVQPAVYAERETLKRNLATVTTDRNGLIVKYDNLKKSTDAIIADLHVQLANCTGSGGNIDQATKDQIAETNTIVKQILSIVTAIKDKILSVFK